MLLHGFTDTRRAWELLLPALEHLVGNSLGGYLALRLAERGRARSVVALAPAGGWAAGDPARQETLEGFLRDRPAQVAAAPHADAIAATPEGRRRATRLVMERPEHLPAALVAHLIRGAAGCEGTAPLVALALREGYALDPARIAGAVRVVWGTEDRLLAWPTAAERYRRTWLPHADWVVLDGVGHCPQLDVPLETAQLVLGHTA